MLYRITRKYPYQISYSFAWVPPPTKVAAAAARTVVLRSFTLAAVIKYMIGKILCIRAYALTKDDLIAFLPHFGHDGFTRINNSSETDNKTLAIHSEDKEEVNN